jgi:hypothetical protein
MPGPFVVRGRLGVRRNRTRGNQCSNGNPHHFTLFRAAADPGLVAFVSVQVGDCLLPSDPSALQMIDLLRLAGKSDLATPDVVPSIPCLLRSFLQSLQLLHSLLSK